MKEFWVVEVVLYVSEEMTESLPFVFTIQEWQQHSVNIKQGSNEFNISPTIHEEKKKTI